MKTIFLLFLFMGAYLVYVDCADNSTNTESNNTAIVTRKPRKYHRYVILAIPRDGEENQTCESSEDDFPKFMSDDAISHGGVVLCICIGIYCFTFLALVCDGYFIPCVETICEVLNISPDVAAATFMSVATSSPEFFTNVIGTFVTESDLGIGTITGSSMFNALGVATIGSMAAIYPIQMDWYPITRDVCIYMFCVSLLVVITWDGIIFWYEGLILFVMYFVYFVIMFNNVRISRFLKKAICRIDPDAETADFKEKDDVEKSRPNSIPPSTRASLAVSSARSSIAEEYAKKHVETQIITENTTFEEEEGSMFKIPKGSKLKVFFFFYTWPLKFFLYYTIPNPIKHRKLLPISFILCIVYIGANSYIVSWMMTIVGNLIQIPDAVLGMTFLAFGSSLPESISLTILARRGEGKMGVSNAMGANSMNILYSLGMPWFLKTITMGANDDAVILIESGSIEYTILALIPIALVLYVTLYFNHFQLRKRVGFVLAVVYSVCIALAVLSEMVFFHKDSDC